MTTNCLCNESMKLYFILNVSSGVVANNVCCKTITKYTLLQNNHCPSRDSCDLMHCCHCLRSQITKQLRQVPFQVSGQVMCNGVILLPHQRQEQSHQLLAQLEQLLLKTSILSKTKCDFTLPYELAQPNKGGSLPAFKQVP